MHSSRMRTVRSSIVMGGLHDRDPPGQTSPGQNRPPWTDKCFGKHYLPASSFAGSNKIVLYNTSGFVEGSVVSSLFWIVRVLIFAELRELASGCSKKNLYTFVSKTYQVTSSKFRTTKIALLSYKSVHSYMCSKCFAGIAGLLQSTCLVLFNLQAEFTGIELHLGLFVCLVYLCNGPLHLLRFLLH